MEFWNSEVACIRRVCRVPDVRPVPPLTATPLQLLINIGKKLKTEPRFPLLHHLPRAPGCATYEAAVRSLGDSVERVV